VANWLEEFWEIEEVARAFNYERGKSTAEEVGSGVCRHQWKVSSEISS
jgi:hypothetical protein